MKPFHTLTNRGQAGRLRRLALAALQQYDLSVRRVRLITNDLNGIFRVDTACGEPYMLRVSLPDPAGHSPAEIRSEMMWLEALHSDTDLGVPRPISARSGALVTTAQMPGVPEPRHCAVFSWVPGPDLADRLSLENMEKLGELSACLHDHAGTFAPPQGFSIPTATSVFPFGDPVVLFDPQYQHLFPPERRRVFELALERIQTAIDALYAGGPGPCVLHYDLHQWNVKVVRGKLYAIDFEDLMWGYPAQDLAVTLYYFQYQENGPALRAAFRRGYTRRREWPERYEGEIDTYLTGRGLDLVNFILQDTNPDYRERVPEFVERAEGRLRAWLEAGHRC
jgi:Ser/Thr protein kinase RdoA (MazF antagonist)